MAWHNRYIIPKDPKKPSGGLRQTVTFIREDLLWHSKKPLIDPHTFNEITLPITNGKLEENELCQGVNILDVLERVKVVDKSTTPPTTDIIWQLRDTNEFFTTLEERDEGEEIIKKKFRAGGTIVSLEDDFIRVEKRSSVSVGSLVYRLAVGMTGNYAIASRRIGELAAAAWSRDLVRAKSLYDIIVASKTGQVSQIDIPKSCFVRSTVSQEVETAILRECCYWLDVDPDTPIQRKMGQPRKHHHRKEKNRLAGTIIELELTEEGTAIGRLLVSFDNLEAGTLLSSLTLMRLVNLLAALKDEEDLADDAELLESYLFAIDEEWEAKAAAQVYGKDTIEVDDPWTTLGIDDSASLKEVKAAYRDIMRKVHPDSSKLPDWISAKINQAYEQLCEELEEE